MASAVTWLGALKRLQLRSLYRAYRGERVRVLRDLPPLPRRPWRTPERQVARQQRRVEFVFRVPGAEAESTRVYWEEERRTLTVHAVAAPRESQDNYGEQAVIAGVDWYAELAVDSDLHGHKAEAFLENETLRVFAPRVDCKPLTGLPLLAWADECSNGSLAAAT